MDAIDRTYCPEFGVRAPPGSAQDNERGGQSCQREDHDAGDGGGVVPQAASDDDPFVQPGTPDREGRYACPKRSFLRMPAKWQRLTNGAGSAQQRRTHGASSFPS